MKPGIATIALKRYDVFTALDLAAEAGFMGVEIWGKPPHTPVEFDETHTIKIKDCAKRLGLEIPVFGSYANPCWPDFEQRSDDALKIANILGARIVRVWAGNKEPGDTTDDEWAFVARSLYEFGLRAEYKGITLAMEMHEGTLTATPEGVLRLIEESKAPNLKLNFQIIDPENPDLERVIDMIGSLVVNVHAQNFRLSNEEGKLKRALIGDGLVDYDRVASLLAAHGFNGYIEAEFLKGESCCEGSMLDAMHKDAEYLRSLAAKYSK